VAKIVLDRVTKLFKDDVIAVDDVSLEIADGEFMVLVGPSGCGKSTLLRLIAGLEEVTAGEVYIGDRQVTDLSPKERDVAMVFQSYALYPNMTVKENLGFGLKLRKTPAERIREAVTQAARVLGLEQQLNRKPAELSGGQRQRVAMGRAMVRAPVAFLMDEPLSNLDAKLRVQMRAELARLHSQLGTTTVYVTHDQVEAMTLGQRVAVLRDGVLQQVDRPDELYAHPVNLFVAAFIGSPPMNFVEATVGPDSLSFGGLELPYKGDLHDYRDRTVVLGIRPSDLEDASVWRNHDLPTIDVVADVVEGLGSEVNVLFTIDAPTVMTDETFTAAQEESMQPLGLIGEDKSVFCARVDPRTSARPEEPLTLTVDPSRFYFFDPTTGQSIGSGQAAEVST
jgi:multiple sugar transport system ATP-binding protein